MKKNQPTTNYEQFLKLDTSRYEGQWIAIAGSKVVAHGPDAQQVYKQAKRKLPTGHISLAKAPDEQMLVLRFHK